MSGFCTNCKGTLKENEVFCSACGSEIKGIKEVYIQIKKKVLFAVMGIMLILVVGAHFFIKSLTDPEKKIESLYNALTIKDEEAFMSNLTIPKSLHYDPEYYLTYIKNQEMETFIKSLIAYSKSVQSDGKSRFIEHEDGLDLFEIKQGKYLFFYPTVEIIPVGTEVLLTTDLTEGSFYVNDKEFSLDGKELEVGILLPGDYEIKTTTGLEEQPDFAEWTIEIDQAEKSTMLILEKSNSLFFLNKDLAQNLNVAEDILFPIETNNGYVYVDLYGETAIEGHFDEASHFSEGLAKVINDEYISYINVDGKTAFDLGYVDYSGDMHDGLILYSGDFGHNSYEFLDKHGKSIFEKKFSEATEFNEGYSLGYLLSEETDEWETYVLKRDGTTIQVNGVIAEYVFDITGFSNGVASIMPNRHEPTSLIRTDGSIVSETERKYATLVPHETGYIEAWTRETGFDEYDDGERKYGALNEDFTVAIEPAEDGLILFSKDSFFIYQDYGWSLVNFKEKLLMDEQFDTVEVLNQKFAAVEQDNQWGVIDAKGNWRVEPNYERIEASQDYFIATKDGELHILDSNFFVINKIDPSLLE